MSNRILPLPPLLPQVQVQPPQQVQQQAQQQAQLLFPDQQNGPLIYGAPMGSVDSQVPLPGVPVLDLPNTPGTVALPLPTETTTAGSSQSVQPGVSANFMFFHQGQGMDRGRS